MVGLGRGEAREGGCLLDALELLTLHCFWKQEGCSCFRFVALYTTVGSSGIVSLFSTRNVWIWGVEIATAWCERSVFKLALRSDGFLAKPSHFGVKANVVRTSRQCWAHRGYSGTLYGSRYVNDESVISHHTVWSVTVGETRWRGEKRGSHSKVQSGLNQLSLVHLLLTWPDHPAWPGRTSEHCLLLTAGKIEL